MPERVSVPLPVLVRLPVPLDGAGVALRAGEVVDQGRVVGDVPALASEPSCPLIPSPSCSVPLLMVVPPVNVLEPARVSVPVPIFVSEPEPLKHAGVEGAAIVAADSQGDGRAGAVLQSDVSRAAQAAESEERGLTLESKTMLPVVGATRRARLQSSCRWPDPACRR